MKRLTKKVNAKLNPYQPIMTAKNNSFYTNNTECFQKLGKLEDLEEEVGKPLEEYIKELEESCERHVKAYRNLNKTFDLYNEAFDLFIEWAVDNDFGYDNLGNLYKQYKEKIECLSYNYGLKYIALKEAERKMENKKK